MDGALAEAYRDAGAGLLRGRQQPARTGDDDRSRSRARSIPRAATCSSCSDPPPIASRAAAAAAGIEIAQFAPFEPWFAGLTISVLALQQHGYDVEHGVEQIIAASARPGRQGPLRARDARFPARHARWHAGGPAAEAAAAVPRGGAARSTKLIKPLLAAWRAATSATLVRSLDEDFEDYPELAEPLIFARNERWAAQVGKMLDDTEDILLVVGALHLVGERGLPELLAGRGFAVERR